MIASRSRSRTANVSSFMSASLPLGMLISVRSGRAKLGRAQADQLDRCREVVDAHQVALAKGLIGADGERPEQVLHGLLRGQRDGQAADAETGQDARDRVAELRQQRDRGDRHHRDLGDARAERDQRAAGRAGDAQRERNRLSAPTSITRASAQKMPTRKTVCRCMSTNFSAGSYSASQGSSKYATASVHQSVSGRLHALAPARRPRPLRLRLAILPLTLLVTRLSASAEQQADASRTAAARATATTSARAGPTASKRRGQVLEHPAIVELAGTSRRCATTVDTREHPAHVPRGARRTMRTGSGTPSGPSIWPSSSCSAGRPSSVLPVGSGESDSSSTQTWRSSTALSLRASSGPCALVGRRRARGSWRRFA